MTLYVQQVSCPLCRHKLSVSFALVMSPRPFVARCADESEGGCGWDFVVEPKVDIEIQTLRIDRTISWEG